MSEFVSIDSKYKGTCTKCKEEIKQGARIKWNTRTKKTYHLGCFKVMFP